MSRCGRKPPPPFMVNNDTESAVTTLLAAAEHVNTSSAGGNVALVAAGANTSFNGNDVCWLVEGWVAEYCISYQINNVIKGILDSSERDNPLLELNVHPVFVSLHHVNWALRNPQIDVKDFIKASDALHSELLHSFPGLIHYKVAVFSHMFKLLALLKEDKVPDKEVLVLAESLLSRKNESIRKLCKSPEVYEKMMTANNDFLTKLKPCLVTEHQKRVKRRADFLAFLLETSGTFGRLLDYWSESMERIRQSLGTTVLEKVYLYGLERVVKCVPNLREFPLMQLVHEKVRKAPSVGSIPVQSLKEILHAIYEESHLVTRSQLTPVDLTRDTQNAVESQLQWLSSFSQSNSLRTVPPFGSDSVHVSPTNESSRRPSTSNASNSSRPPSSLNGLEQPMSPVDVAAAASTGHKSVTDSDKAHSQQQAHSHFNTGSAVGAPRTLFGVPASTTSRVFYLTDQNFTRSFGRIIVELNAEGMTVPNIHLPSVPSVNASTQVSHSSNASEDLSGKSMVEVAVQTKIESMKFSTSAFFKREFRDDLVNSSTSMECDSPVKVANAPTCTERLELATAATSMETGSPVQCISTGTVTDAITNSPANTSTSYQEKLSPVLVSTSTSTEMTVFTGKQISPLLGETDLVSSSTLSDEDVIRGHPMFTVVNHPSVTSSSRQLSTGIGGLPKHPSTQDCEKMIQTDIIRSHNVGVGTGAEACWDEVEADENEYPASLQYSSSDYVSSQGSDQEQMEYEAVTIATQDQLTNKDDSFLASIQSPAIEAPSVVFEAVKGFETATEEMAVTCSQIASSDKHVAEVVATLAKRQKASEAAKANTAGMLPESKTVSEFPTVSAVSVSKVAATKRQKSSEHMRPKVIGNSRGSTELVTTATKQQETSGTATNVIDISTESVSSASEVVAISTEQTKTIKVTDQSVTAISRVSVIADNKSVKLDTKAAVELSATAPVIKQPAPQPLTPSKRSHGLIGNIHDSSSNNEAFAKRKRNVFDVFESMPISTNSSPSVSPKKSDLYQELKHNEVPKDWAVIKDNNYCEASANMEERCESGFNWAPTVSLIRFDLDSSIDMSELTNYEDQSVDEERPIQADNVAPFSHYDHTVNSVDFKPSSRRRVDADPTTVSKPSNQRQNKHRKSTKSASVPGVSGELTLATNKTHERSLPKGQVNGTAGPQGPLPVTPESTSKPYKVLQVSQITPIRGTSGKTDIDRSGGSSRSKDSVSDGTFVTASPGTESQISEYLSTESGSTPTAVDLFRHTHTSIVDVTLTDSLLAAYTAPDEPVNPTHSPPVKTPQFNRSIRPIMLKPGSEDVVRAQFCVDPVPTTLVPASLVVPKNTPIKIARATYPTVMPATTYNNPSS